MSSADEQNAYLCGLIIVQEIQNRRPRKDEEVASLRDASYAYRVRFLDEENVLKEINVCRTAFLSIHGIKKKKYEGLQKGLKNTGKAAKTREGNSLRHTEDYLFKLKMQLMNILARSKEEKVITIFLNKKNVLPARGAKY